MAAVGDYYNDVELLKAVPLLGRCGERPDEVKALADYVACHCDDGAVADVLRRLELLATGQITDFGNREKR